jgi:serine/threonine-protein kinase
MAAVGENDFGSDSTIVGAERADHILIVDDQAPVRMLLQKFLEKHGYTTCEAEDGEQALEVVVGGDVDLVITDMIMPGINGHELLTEVRMRFPKLPVIVMTGQPVVNAAVECIKSGASDYVSKPIDFKYLLRSVKSVLADARKERRQTQWVEKSGGITDNMIGEYKISETIGQGSMGTVFQAHRADGDDDTAYAIKVLKHMPYADDADRQRQLDRFVNEGEAASSVHHPNIVHIYEYGVTSEQQVPYIVMERLTGDTLRPFIEKHQDWGFTQRAGLIVSAANALAALHGSGIVHRDIKPDNMMVDANMNLKLADFGIARLPGSTMTLTQNIMGSPAYLSPEAFLTSKLDHRTDIFSLGVVAYELFTGQRPFQGDSLARYAQTTTNDLPKRPSSIIAEFPARLEEIIAKMLKKEPDARYQSAAQVAMDLQMFVNLPNAPASDAYDEDEVNSNWT